MKGLVKILNITEIADMLELSTTQIYKLIKAKELKYGTRRNSKHQKLRGVVDDDMLEFLLQHPEYLNTAKYTSANKAFHKKLETLTILVEIYSTLKLIENKLEYIRILANLLDK